MSITEGLDFVIGDLLPAFLHRFDSWMITDNVSALGFCVAVGVLVIVVGTVVLRV